MRTPPGFTGPTVDDSAPLVSIHHPGSLEAWERDCRHYRDRTLEGRHGHYCPDWDELPIDETCAEWPCPCDEGADARRQADKA